MGPLMRPMATILVPHSKHALRLELHVLGLVADDELSWPTRMSACA